MDKQTTRYRRVRRHPIETLTKQTHPAFFDSATADFRFSLIGGLGASFRIDGSADLMNWTPLGWITNNFGTSQFLGAAAVTNASQFYRAVAQ
jgi:hypothetical protein